MAFSSLLIFCIFAIAQQSLATFITTENTCQQTFSINDGNVKYSTNNGIQKFSYSCENGFIPNSKTFSVCFNGQWSIPNPSCVDQSTVRTVENGYIVITTDNKYLVKCNPGYIISGNEIITPGQTEWPTCVEKKIDSMSINNGNYKIVNNGKIMCYYVCNKGYQISGENHLVYQNNQWIGTPPVCNKIEETKTEHNINFPNGSFNTPDNGYTYVFKCNTGFQLIGKEIIQFKNNQWTDSVPVCVEIEETKTEHNINFPNGFFVTPDNGYTYVFKCNTGFQLIGKEIIQFINNQWTDSVPVCIAEKNNGADTHVIPITIPTPIPTPVVRVIPNGRGVTNADGSITFTCNNGYSIIGNNVVPVQSNQFPVCVPTNDLVIENGKIEVSIVSNGYELLYKCDEEYQISGDEKVVSVNGQQINNKPKCVLACPIIYFKNGWVESNNESSTAHFGCCDGFQINGANESTCINGLWTNPTPSCIPLCKEINLMNGKATYKKDSTTFSCNPGFSLIGVEETTCNNGQWMAETPICVPNCPAPQIENGQFTVDEGKQTIKFICNSGYDLIGSSEISCHYGQWSQPAPVCQAACQPFHINNGVARNTKDLKVLHIQCNSGYVLKGTQDISCISGNWNAPIPTCIPLCEAVRTYGIQVDSREMMKYNCNPSITSY